MTFGRPSSARFWLLSFTSHCTACQWNNKKTCVRREIDSVAVEVISPKNMWLLLRSLSNSRKFLLCARYVVSSISLPLMHSGAVLYKYVISRLLSFCSQFTFSRTLNSDNVSKHWWTYWNAVVGRTFSFETFSFYTPARLLHIKVSVRRWT